MDLMSDRVKKTLASLFQPDPSTVVPAVNNEVPQTDILSSLLTPNNEAGSRLATMLESMPRREDFQPSRMTNILSRINALSGSQPAGISGGQPVGYISSGNVSDKLNNNLNRGFNQAMIDWGSQIKPLGELADAERAQNTNNRLIASTMLRDEKANKDRESRETIAQDKLDLDKDRLAQKREYAAIVQAKNMMPNAAMAEDKDGRVYTWDKKTGQFLNYLTNDTGEIVESSKLPEQEKMQIQQGNELQKIAARGSQSRQTVELQGKNALENTAARGTETRKNIEARGTEQRQTNKEKPTSVTAAAKSGKTIKVYDPAGRAGSIPAEQWEAAKRAGYTVRY